MNWIPKTKLGLKVIEHTYESLFQLLETHKIVEPEIVDYFQQQLTSKVVDTCRISHSKSSGKVYMYRVVVLVGKPGLIGCGVAKNIVKALAVKKAIVNAKKNLVSLKKLHVQQIYTPYRIVSSKKGATLVTISPLQGYSITASKSGKIYCNLCGLKGLKVTTGNKKRVVKGKAVSKLNYYTALHQALKTLL